MYNAVLHECRDYEYDKVKEIIFYDIIPMLHEYWFDDKQKVDFWENELKSLF